MPQAIRHLAAHLWPAGREDGQGLGEYALILALIAIVAILSLVFLGDTIADLMSYINAEYVDRN